MHVSVAKVQDCDQSFVIIIPPTSVGRGNYKMMVGVCPSVCRVPRLTRERKGLGSPNLAGWKPITRELVILFRGQKVKGSRSQADYAVTDNAPYTDHVGGITIKK